MFRNNVVFRVTAKYMKLNKKRTLTTFVGIVFMVLLMTCVFVGKDTAVRFLDKLVSERRGFAHVTVYDATPTEQAELIDGACTTDYSRTAVLAVLDFPETGNAERPYLQIKGYDTKAFDWFNIDLKEGRLPKNASELVITESIVAEGADFHIGDLVAGKYTIVGICKAPYFEHADDEAYLVFTLYTGGTEQTCNLSLRFSSAVKDDDLEQIFDRFEERGYSTNEYSLLLIGAGKDNVISQLILFVEGFFLVLILLASVVLISNVFLLSYRERCRYLGMLSSVGATAKQRRSSVYFEAFTLLLPALVVGFCAGLLMVYGGMKLLQPHLVRLMSETGLVGTTNLSLFIRPGAIVWIILFSVITVFISALRPAYRIGKNGAVDNIRGNEGNQKKLHSRKKSPIFGAHGLLAGCYLFRQPKKRKSVSRSLMIFLVILLVTATGSKGIHMLMVDRYATKNAIAITPAKNMLLFSCSAFSNEPGMMLKATYEEKMKTYEEEKKKLVGQRDIRKIDSFSVGTYMGCIAEDLVCEEYKQAVREYSELQAPQNAEERERLYVNTLRGANVLATMLVLPDEKIKELAKAAGVSETEILGTDGLSAFLINEVTVDAAVIGYYNGRNPVHFEKATRHLTVTKGQQLTVDFFSLNYWAEEPEENIPISITIAGLLSKEDVADYVQLNSQEAVLVFSEKAADTIADRLGDYARGQVFSEITRIFAYDKKAACLNEIYDLAYQGENGMLEEDCNYTLSDSEETTLSKKEAVIKIVDIMLGCFTALTSVICLMNLVNSIDGRLLDRRKEFATMLSIGIVRNDMRKSLLLECVGLILEGVGSGLLLSGLLSLVFHLGFKAYYGGMTLIVPVALGVGAIVGISIAVVAITMLCFQNVKLENILDSIREESV